MGLRATSSHVLLLALACGAAPVSGIALFGTAWAEERLVGGAFDASILRPSIDRDTPHEGTGATLRHVLPEIGAGVAHAARNGLPAARLSDRDLDAPVPDGSSAPALAGQGIMGRLRLDTRDPGSLDTTVSAALRGSLETRRAQAAARAAHAGRHAAALAFLPTVSGRLSYGDGPNTARPIGLVARQTSVSVGVEASLPIFTSGVLTSQLAQARSLAKAADMNFLAAERKAALDAALAHVDVRLQRRIAAAVGQNRAALARIAKVANALFEAGEVSRTDVAIARANMEAVAADEADAARRVADAEAGYASLTGRKAPRSLILPATEQASSLAAAIGQAVAKSPTLAAQDHGAAALAHAARAERGRYGPQVEAYANAEQDVHHSTLPKRDMDYTFGVRLTVPLVAPSAIASISGAREEAVSARYGVLEAERTLRRRVATLWNAREAAERRVRAFERQMRHVDLTVRGTLREYEAGFRSITDVLEAQVKRLEANIALEGAIHERASAGLRLDFAKGRALLPTNGGASR